MRSSGKSLTALLLTAVCFSSCMGGEDIGTAPEAVTSSTTVGSTVTEPTTTTTTATTVLVTAPTTSTEAAATEAATTTADTTTTTTTTTTATTTTTTTTTTAKKPDTTTTTTTTRPVLSSTSSTAQSSAPIGEYADITAKLSETFKPVTSSGGRYAVKVVSLQNGAEFGSGEQTSALVSASLIKLYVAGAVFENLTAVNAQQKYNGETESLVSAMISNSDNVACNTLVQRLGGGNYDKGMAAVNSFCAQHGFNATQINRIMLNFNGKENYTSVTDCSKFLGMIYRGELAGSDKIIAYMKAQKTRTKIPAGITDGTVVANKTGELAAVENDTAIVYAKNGPYIICVMCTNLSNTYTARQAISKASAQVYGYMK